MKKLKVLIVTQYFWPENFKINDLTFHLARLGHDIQILTGIPNYPTGKYFNGYGMFSKKTEKEQGVLINRVFLLPRG